MSFKLATFFVALITTANSLAAPAKSPKVKDGKPGAPKDANSAIPWYCDPGEPADYVRVFSLLT